MAKKIEIENMIGFENLNLTEIPFEPQGEFDPNISLDESILRVNELKTINEIIDMSRLGGKLVSAVIEGEPSAGKTHLANKLMNQSIKFHPSTKHIYLRMESGAFDDHFFILSLIVNRLEIETKKLDQSKVNECIKKALEFSFKGLEIENIDKDELRRATKLMSIWYGYIKALVDVGEHDCVVIHIDEVEDRWGSLSMNTAQIERDLKHLRDLLGYLQTEELKQEFPVTLLLYMTDMTYQRIGGVNNALQTRLSRVVRLTPFSEKDALDLAKVRLLRSRINKKIAEEFYPFTKDAISLIAKKSNDQKGIFALRSFIINCHDILYYYARRRGGEIDKIKINEFFLERGGSKIERPDSAIESQEGLDIVEIKETKVARDKFQRYKQQGLLEKKDLQLELAIKNMNIILSNCSDRFSMDTKTKKMIATIPGEKARIPISIKKLGEGLLKTDIFNLFITNTIGSTETLPENEFVLELPQSTEMMVRYALFDSAMLTTGELNKAKDGITEQVAKLLEKINKYYKKYSDDHYVSHLIAAKLQKEEDYDNFIIELYNLTKGNLKKVNLDHMEDCGFYDGAGFATPNWYNQIVSYGIYNPEHLWKDVFYFNSEIKSVESVIQLLKKLQVTDGIKLKNFEDRKISISREINQSCEHIESSMEKVKNTIGDLIKERFASKANKFVGQLRLIENDINTFDPTDKLLSNFVEIYYHEGRMKSINLKAQEFISSIETVSEVYGTKKTCVLAALRELKVLRFKNKKLEKDLNELSNEIDDFFNRSNISNFAEFISKNFEEVMSSYTKFFMKATSIEKEILTFNFEELKKSSQLNIIDIDTDALMEDWKLIHENDNMGLVEVKLNGVKENYSNLEVKASDYLSSLNKKLVEGKSLIQKFEKYINKEYLANVMELFRQMEENIERCRQSYKKGKLSEVFGVNIDQEYNNLGPSLKSLFDLNVEYSIQDISRKFEIDSKKTIEFVRFLEDNNILISKYIVA